MNILKIELLQKNKKSIVERNKNIKKEKKQRHEQRSKKNKEE